MSRSHKERHAWKRKERNRTGKSDPAKVRIHRERFLAALKMASLPVELFDRSQRYEPLVFQACLELDPEEQQSTIFLEEQEIEIPFLVENPADCHYAISEIKPDFDPEKEKEILDRHIRRARTQNFPCRLEVIIDDTRLCSSVIECRYRQFNTETSQALCTLPRS